MEFGYWKDRDGNPLPDFPDDGVFNSPNGLMTGTTIVRRDDVVLVRYDRESSSCPSDARIRGIVGAKEIVCYSWTDLIAELEPVKSKFAEIVRERAEQWAEAAFMLHPTSLYWNGNIRNPDEIECGCVNQLEVEDAEPRPTVILTESDLVAYSGFVNENDLDRAIFMEVVLELVSLRVTISTVGYELRDDVWYALAVRGETKFVLG